MVVWVAFANGVMEDGAMITLLLSNVLTGVLVVRVALANGDNGAMVALLVLLLQLCKYWHSNQISRKYTPKSSCEGNEACHQLRSDGLGDDVDDVDDSGGLFLRLRHDDLPIRLLLHMLVLAGDILTIRYLLDGVARTGVELAIVQIDNNTPLELRMAIAANHTGASGRTSDDQGSIRCNFGEMHMSIL